MAEPPIVVIGSSAGTERRWALLPSGQVLWARCLDDLFFDVERAMARAEPDRPFMFRLHRPDVTEPPLHPAPHKGNDIATIKGRTLRHIDDRADIFRSS
jgi:hypothetical protein